MEVGTNYLKRSQTSSQESEDQEVPWTEHFRRHEQNTIDSIMKGEEHGHYYVLLGPKVFQIHLTIQYDLKTRCRVLERER
jgi:hypothetical protein